MQIQNLDSNSVWKANVLWQSDTWVWQVVLPAYDSEKYTLNYAFKRDGLPPFVITSVPNPLYFDFSVPSSTTTTYAPGLYNVVAYLMEIATGNRTTLGNSQITIKPDLMLGGSADPRTHNQIMLDTVNDALDKSAGSDVIEYTVAGTTVKKSRKELLDLRAHYMKLVRREQGKPAVSAIYYSL